MSATKVGIAVECKVCGQRKSPIGRSAPLGAYLCDHECEGYRQEPYVGSLWPGETDEDFGYPCNDDGTKPIHKVPQSNHDAVQNAANGEM